MPAAGGTVAPGGFQSKGGGGARNKNNLKYGTPLPILLPSSPLHPAYRPDPLPTAGSSAVGSSSSSKPSKSTSQPISSSSKSSTSSPLSTLSALGAFLPFSQGISRPITPQIHGTFDPDTRSVWVTDPADREVLFDRGFFGKGTLSRSEPTWQKTRVDLLKGGATFAAEQIRQKRREERKKFKIDRAAAMMDAAKKAEAVLTGQLDFDSASCIAASGGEAGGIEAGASAFEGILESDPILGDVDQGGMEGESDQVPRPASPALSTTTLATSATGTTLPAGTQLTPQTFLVRPTRPDANRNRGRKAFKRRPAPPAQQGNTGQVQGQGGQQQQQQQQQRQQQAIQVVGNGEEGEDEEEEDEFELDEEIVKDMEHLQLGLEEAWFLSEGLGVLRIFDPVSQTYAPFSNVLPLLLTPTPTLNPTVPQSPPAALYPDDPLLVSYAVYHHFRSLGWVVRDGVKFCVDWLLYRRGPVFSHSAFSIVMIPEYEDESDRETSPYRDTDWYRDRLSWKWMNTIVRVNSLVQKTIILVYVTIPARSSFPARHRLSPSNDEDNSEESRPGGLDVRNWSSNGMRGLMSRYHIREVALTRFGPARRRD